MRKLKVVHHFIEVAIKGWGLGIQLFHGRRLEFRWPFDVVEGFVAFGLVLVHDLIGVIEAHGRGI